VAPGVAGHAHGRDGDTLRRVTMRDRKRAAQGLRRLLERIEQGELDAPAWYRQRLTGAIIALDPGRATRETTL
jgi:hypothetical protein